MQLNPPARCFEILQATDALIAQARGLTNQRPRKLTTALWLDLANISRCPADKIVLQGFSSEADWNSLFELRVLVEAKFGISDRDQVSRMILETKRCQSELEAQWYLARKSDGYELVGEVGIVTFTFGDQKIGRLQDIDIIPEYQGRQLGNELLNSTFQLAKNLELSALCLKADSDDWPLAWYQRRGFQIVGEWMS